jgi:hypothetical protein
MSSREEHLKDIRQLEDEHVTNEEIKREWPALLDAYEDIFREVEELAGSEQVDALAEWIKDQIEHNDLPPGMLSTASKAARICRDAGADVSESEWFDEAVQ